MSSKARAFNERGNTVENPISDDLHALLGGLTLSNRFVVVERLDAENAEYYMQAYLRDDGASGWSTETAALTHTFALPAGHCGCWTGLHNVALPVARVAGDAHLGCLVGRVGGVVRWRAGGRRVGWVRRVRGAATARVAAVRDRRPRRTPGRRAAEGRLRRRGAPPLDTH